MSSIRSGLIKSAELVLPRRGFLGLLTGALVTPVIIKVATLMRISPQPKLVLPRELPPRPKMVWYSGYEEVRWNDEMNRWDGPDGPLAVSPVGAYSAGIVEVPARQGYTIKQPLELYPPAFRGNSPKPPWASLA